MKAINQDKVIYQLTIEDLQKVATEILERNLTENELKLIEDKISDNIDWYGAIENRILQNIK
ncbi:MAG: hypothetical protein Q4G63_05830 [Bacteroidia bacterium]|nr:hypothetical protein [Bacteroidia bacterium]